LLQQHVADQVAEDHAWYTPVRGEYRPLVEVGVEVGVLLFEQFARRAILRNARLALLCRAAAWLAGALLAMADETNQGETTMLDRTTVLSGATRRAMITGLAGTSAALLAACGAGGSTGGEGATGDNSAAPARQNVTVKITARQTPEQDMWPVRVPAFQERYPHIRVEPDLHAGNIQEKIATLIAADDIGDVVHTHPSAAQPQRLFLGGSMRGLDALVAKDRLDLRQWYPLAIEAGRLDGKLISLPFKGKMAAVALFVNQTLFEQAGLPLPNLNTTVNELTEMAVKLTRPDGSQWGIAGTMPKDSRTLTGTIRRWNAELLSRDWMNATLDTTEARAAFAWYYDGFHRRRIMDPTANQAQLFRDGKAAMLMNLDFNQKTTIHPAAESQGFKYTATLVAKGPTGRRGGIWIPDALQLSSTTKHPDEAWEALKWFTDKDTGLALAQQQSQGTSTTPGARPDVYNDPAFLNHPVFPRILQELDRDSNVLPESYQVPGNYKIPEFNAVLGAAVDKIWKNEAEPTPGFLKALNDELQNVLRLPR
jgi:ABC-type glycerol-3-phosphate transport system substrate-binding protein